MNRSCLQCLSELGSVALLAGQGGGRWASVGACGADEPEPARMQKGAKAYFAF